VLGFLKKICSICETKRWRWQLMYLKHVGGGEIVGRDWVCPRCWKEAHEEV
jgi:hypothetical protein